ncbi:MAG: peptide chain release factor 2 [Acidobacteria bacterium 13_1_20CM_2_68_7]|nr:MAG: peptide chain release factor 2 [Acidobacteria bacterium 13_1_20CM_2_68_7]
METKVADPALWSDPARAQTFLRTRTRLNEEIDSFRRLEKKLEEAEVCAELAREGEDVFLDLKQAVDSLQAALDDQELEMMLTGEHDAGDAILTIHPGAGGTESQDWAEMLYRMYLRWAEGHGYRVETLDYQKGEEAGLKSVTLMVKGKNAFGFLRAESGVHRLVRISPFDSSGRRHTSFASVYAYAGGQHVNVTDSAVRITHLPSGIVVSCQNERSQHRNRDMAMKILRARLYELERRKRDEKRQAEEGAKKEIDFGSQIRSYVLQPYTLVKDHRTSVERGDVARVLDGDLDGFIHGYLLGRSREAAETGGEPAGRKS